MPDSQPEGAVPVLKGRRGLCFQMQPFDLLGITIKSLAEIEKEVRQGGRGWAGSCTPGSLLG